jgi:hypothetical protein
MRDKIIKTYKYPVHRYCGESDCTSRKRLGRHRFKAEIQRWPSHLGDERQLVVGMVWGHWFRVVSVRR